MLIATMATDLITQYDWVRWLFQIIPEDVRVIEPKPDAQKNLCDGLHTLRNVIKDSDRTISKGWEFVKLTEECGMFKMGGKRIYWWLDPEKAMVATPDIDSVKFKEWCTKEYSRIILEDKEDA
jgi:hypothetical protein